MSYSVSITKILDEVGKDPQVKKAMDEWNNRRTSVTYEQAQQFSKILGSATAKVLEPVAENMTAAGIKSLYTRVTNVLERYCDDVVKNMNNKAKVKYMADVTNNVKEEVDNMLEHLATRIREAEDFETVRFLTEENAARSITRKTVTSHMQYTSRSQQRAGLNIKIVRDEGSGCCDYCAGLTGTYTSFDDLPSDFWSVHRGCTCVFHYNVGKTSESIRFETNDDGSLSKITE